MYIHKSAQGQAAFCDDCVNVGHLSASRGGGVARTCPGPHEYGKNSAFCL